MTSAASTARPPWSRYVWADHNAIFVEIPDAAGGAPYILKFDNCENGLGKALSLLRNAHERADRTNYSTPMDDPRIKKAKFSATISQRESVRSILKKRGMLGEK